METQRTTGSREDHTDLEAVVQGNAAFALHLYQQLQAREEGNLFFSPYSISTALAMTCGGARGNTEVQMAQALHFTLGQTRLHPAFASLEARLKTVKERGNAQLKIANALWPQKDYEFLKEYLALTREYYGVLITSLNFSEAEAARRTINAWGEERTEGKIKNLIPRGILSDLTRLVLTNAIYFKGDWAYQFDKVLTEEAPFWVTPAERLEVPMMTQVQAFRYAKTAELQILELPYAGDDLSMIVLLPEKVDGLAELEGALTVENLERWGSDLREEEVEVYLPRFRMNCQFRLKDVLKSMGVMDAFSDEADFSGMDGTQWLYISDVIHQAFVDVNEEGTEAAAATAVVMRAKYMPPPRPVFRADHPFVFLIRENDMGSILFLGRVMNPKYGVA